MLAHVPEGSKRLKRREERDGLSAKDRRCSNMVLSPTGQTWSPITYYLLCYRLTRLHAGAAVSSLRLPFLSRRASCISPTTLPAQYESTSHPAPPELPEGSSNTHAFEAAIAAAPARRRVREAGLDVEAREEMRGRRGWTGNEERNDEGGGCMMRPR